MIQIATKEVALQAALDGKEVKGFVRVTDTDQGRENPFDVLTEKEEIQPGAYECHRLVNVLDRFDFFLADVEPESAKKSNKKSAKQMIDVGKIIALHTAGWSYAKIADEMRISVPTVQRYVKQYHERDYLNEIESGEA